MPWLPRPNVGCARRTSTGSTCSALASIAPGC
nr:MAG TPA: hypothetical protein [Caudoviricetes sp.]